VQVSEHLTISLHEDWKIESAKGTVDDAAFSLKWSAYNPDPRTVRLEHTWESKADAVKKERMVEYSANAAEARRQLGYFLTWTNSAAASADVPGDEPTGANVPMVALAIVVLLIAVAVAAILATKRAVNLDSPPVLDGTEIPIAPSELAPGRLEGLGGWLILVGFGLLVRPVIILVLIVQGWSAYFDAQVWHRLTTPGGEFFLENFALVASLELVINIVLLVYSVLLLVLYFRKSHLFPGCIQVFFLFAITTGVFAIWSAFALNQGTEDIETYKPLMQALIASAIWIPYFRVSRRVKCTFTR
jgi:hypothetical protein